MFKTLLAICLVGAAYAEADADAFYGYGGYGNHGYAGYAGYGGYGHGYGGYGHLGYAGLTGHHGAYAHVPFGSSTGLDPITQGLDASTQGAVGYGYYGHHLGKREADADAFYGYGGYGNHGYAGYAGYGGHLGYAGYGGYGHGYGGYGHLGYAGLTGHHGAYAHVPFGSSTGLDPITQGLDASTQGAIGHYGHHLGKREADADAFYGYGGYGHHGYAGYGHLGYAGYSHLGYGHQGAYAGYGHHGAYAHVPFGSSTGLDPITQGLDASTQGHVGYGHHY